MKKILNSIALYLVVTISYAVPINSPIGYWKTIDDVSHTPKSILELSMDENEYLQGKVVKIFGKDPSELCTACKGRNHNKPILGMILLEKLQANLKSPGEWSNGSIIDPANGKIYHCYVRVSANGQQLTIRGFVGIPLFGRSQTWVRVASFES